MGRQNRRHSEKDPAPKSTGEGGRRARSAERFAAVSGAKRRAFGVDDRVACSTCGQDTYLRRRSAHTADGNAYEHQTFACRACKASTTRVVDSEGRPSSELGEHLTPSEVDA
jgi:hypothetical protein